MEEQRGAITLAMLTRNLTVHYEPISYSPRIGRSKIQPVRDTLRFFHLIIRMGILFAPMRTLLPFSAALFGLFDDREGADRARASLSASWVDVRFVVTETMTSQPEPVAAVVNP